MLEKFELPHIHLYSTAMFTKRRVIDFCRVSTSICC